jgi:hypothetical protein
VAGALLGWRLSSDSSLWMLRKGYRGCGEKWWMVPDCPACRTDKPEHAFDRQLVLGQGGVLAGAGGHHLSCVPT